MFVLGEQNLNPLLICLLYVYSIIWPTGLSLIMKVTYRLRRKCNCPPLPSPSPLTTESYMCTCSRSVGHSSRWTTQPSDTPWKPAQLHKHYTHQSDRSSGGSGSGRYRPCIWQIRPISLARVTTASRESHGKESRQKKKRYDWVYSWLLIYLLLLFMIIDGWAEE